MVTQIEDVSPALKLEPQLPYVTAGRTPGRKRVLIVEDNDDAGEALAMVMGVFGCETRVAHDAPTAIAVIHSFDPDLALLDVGLPIIDGYELARQVRQLPGRRVMRLVAITGYGQKRDIVNALAAGFDEHLTKPVDMATLEAVLSRVAAVSAAGGTLPL